MGFSTFLGAIYTLAGVEESFYRGEGKGATAVELGGKCYKERWVEGAKAQGSLIPGLGGGPSWCLKYLLTALASPS